MKALVNNLKTVGRKLTRREKEIIQLLSLGLQQKEIAAQLFISPQTVKTHVKNTYEKLAANNKIEALRKCGLLQKNTTFGV